jgi:hypothetical protein
MQVIVYSVRDGRIRWLVWGWSLPRMEPWAGLFTVGRAFSGLGVRRHVPWLDAEDFRDQARTGLV